MFWFILQVIRFEYASIAAFIAVVGVLSIVAQVSIDEIVEAL